MAETIPILSGMALGAIVGLCRGRVPAWATAVMVCLFAGTATVGSGEFRLGWSYLLVDAALVVAGAAVAIIVLRRLRASFRPAERARLF